jgi:hypothetical protein
MSKKLPKNPYQPYMLKDALHNHLAFKAVWLTKAFKDFSLANQVRYPDEASLRSAFIGTPEGQEVLAVLEVFELREMAISYDRELYQGKYLTIRVDLSFPKNRILAEFQRILNEKHLTINRPPRGEKLRTKAEINQMLRAYELVEDFMAQGESYHQALIKTAVALFSKTRSIRLADPPSVDRRYQQIRRWHQTLKNRLGTL